MAPARARRTGAAGEAIVRPARLSSAVATGSGAPGRDARLRGPAGAGHFRGRVVLAVTAGALVAAGALPLSLEAQPTVRARQASQAATPAEELTQLRRQLEDVRSSLERYVASLAGRPTTDAVLDSITSLQRSMAMLMQRAELMEERARFRALEARLERDDSTPQGWFGVDVQTLSTSSEQNDGRVLVSADYPRVVAVEPGSPAARAGLVAGDRLISIRGTDLRGQPLDLRSILRPGTRVPVRVEREGVLRDMVVAITTRPSSFAPGTRVRVLAMTPDGGGDRVAGATVTAAAQGRGGAGPEVASRVVATRVEVGAPSPSAYLFRLSPSMMTVAGAELIRVTDALRESLGVSGGIYVVSVAPRTPAERAGVKEGDVLQRADGVAMDAPVDFFRLIQQQTDGRVRLELVRSRKPLSVDLRW